MDVLVIPNVIILGILNSLRPSKIHQYVSKCCQSQLKRYKRDCGQNPRLFLKEEKGFGKVHKGRVREGNRSLHQVLQAGHHGLKELGYPNWRHTLVSLYGGYEEKDEENESDADKKMKSLSERTTIPEASLIRSI